MKPENPLAAPFLLQGLIFVFASFSLTLHAQRTIKNGINELTVHSYSQLPTLGLKLDQLPEGAVAIRYKGRKWYYVSGVFMQLIKDRYQVTLAPAGLRLPALPAAHYRVVTPGETYFYYYGNFYRRSRRGTYQVIEAPVGAVVNALPKGFHSYRLDGNGYFVYEQNYYRCVELVGGETLYEVVPFTDM